MRGKSKSKLGMGRRNCLGAMGGGAMLLGSCRLSGQTKAPYTRDNAPSPAQLHAALAPRVSKLKIRAAKVRDELTPSAKFAASVEAPGRIHASLFIKGQKIMSLIANENGYGLRYNFNRGLAPGYYHGPKDRCAVQTFLGAPIEVDDLIAILLGGGPSSFRADAVLSQSWDPEVGAERVVFFDRQRQRSLVAHFILRQENWVLYSANGYRYQDKSPIWEWSVRHLDFGQVQGAPMLPSRIKIGRLDGGTKRYLELSIEQATTQVEFGDKGNPNQPPSWGDDEDEEDGSWEGADGSEVAPPTTAPQSSAQASQPIPRSDIPSIFLPSGEGLTDRGPLCRSGRS